MPSMLGLTTDPSPHGLAAAPRGKSPSGHGQVAVRGSGAVTGGANGSLTRHPKSTSPQGEAKKEKPSKNTIFGRNHQAAIEMETLLWRALCDDPDSAMDYMAKEGIMANPLLFDGDTAPKSKDTSPSLEEALRHASPALSYKMHDPHVVEIDLMAVAIVYRATLFRQTEDVSGNGKGSFEAVECTGSSSWRQEASGDWKCTTMHVAPLY